MPTNTVSSVLSYYSMTAGNLSAALPDCVATRYLMKSGRYVGFNLGDTTYIVDKRLELQILIKV